MTRIIAITLTAIALGACTMTTTDGTPIVVTQDNAAPLVLAQLQKACKYQAPAAIAKDAVFAAIKASEDTKQTAATVQSLAEIACALLAPPPAAVAVKPPAG